MSTPTMRASKVMWTALYMPVHDLDIRARPDLRVECNALSAMWSWVRRT